MPSGGHARSGPPPDPNALRRDRDKAEWRHLPASGRTGDAPAWPLSKATARERTLWATEWTRPQAIVWEEVGLAQEVALYVRSLVAAERANAPVAARVLVLRQLDALGISIAGQRMHRWIIDQGTAEAQQVTTPNDPDRSSAKARFRTIEGGAAS